MPETVREILKNFKYEMGLNLPIVRPSPGTRDCSAEFRVDYFGNNQDKLGQLPTGLADRLRETYAKMEEQNRYIRILLEVGYDRFKSDHWNEFMKWNNLCRELLADVQQLDRDLENLTREEPSTLPLEIFVSYSSKDKETAGRVADVIKQTGGRPFLAHETIEVSTEWRAELLKYLRTCSAIFCLITKNFLDSEWTQQEAGFAIARNVKVVPLLFNGLKPPGFIEAFQGIHVRDDNLERIVKERMESIKASLAATNESQQEGARPKESGSRAILVGGRIDAISELGWQILEAAKGSSGTSMATMEIANAVGKDNATVYDECTILRDFGYLHFTDDSHGMALLKITGQGLQALRNRPKFT